MCAVMTRIQTRMVNDNKVRWRKRHDIAYSDLIEMCSAHPSASTASAFYEEIRHKIYC